MSTFYLEAALDAGATVTLSEAAAHHVRVKRHQPGDTIRLTDGVGRVAEGTLARIARASVEVAIGRVRDVARPAPLVLFAPVGDRERMLWLAEKATEFAITKWQPVLFQRSRSVSPRGEGAAFGARIRSRMVSALEQSGGAWLPSIAPEIDLAAAAAAEGPAVRLLLDASGTRIDPAEARDGASVILGPEGGLEAAERDLLVGRGWRPVSLGGTVLRFETAGIAAVAILRAAHPPAGGNHG